MATLFPANSDADPQRDDAPTVPAALFSEDAPLPDISHALAGGALLSEPVRPAVPQGPSPEQRKQVALELIDTHHKRIADTIRNMWGYKECSAYINKLIMSGGDGMGNARIGFNQQAVEAMLVLVEIHDAQFGNSTEGSATGFADSSVRSGLDGAR
jgi:hypothetical protein